MRPHPPSWALEAGLPGPGTGESFRAYTSRLGLDTDMLLDGLGDDDEWLANLRLGTAIIRGAPDSFRASVSARLARNGWRPRPDDRGGRSR